MNAIVIDADPHFRAKTLAVFRSLCVSAFPCENSWRSWQTFARVQPSLIVLGPSLEEKERSAYLSRLAEVGGETPRQVVAVLPQSSVVAEQQEMLDLGVDDFLAAPYTTAQLQARLQLALERWQKQTDAAKARKAAAQFQLALENMPMLVMAIDASGKLVAWNERCAKLTGYSAAEMVGNPDALKMLFDRQSGELSEVLPVAGENQWRWRIVGRDGKHHTIEWSQQTCWEGNVSEEASSERATLWAIGRLVSTPRPAASPIPCITR